MFTEANRKFENREQAIGFAPAPASHDVHPVVIKNLRAIAGMLSRLEGRWTSMACRIEQCAETMERAAQQEDYARVTSELATADALLREIRPNLSRWLS
ncbi:hypothetical protein CCP2SC5_580016 [Azospirillaceae bacterium]